MASSTSLKHHHQTWSRESYLISTDPSLIPIAKLNAFFASKDVYWATPLPEEVMQQMLQSSLCFGLFSAEPETPTRTHSHEAESTDNFIGLARCVTDFTTFVYLTDVYIDPAYQGKGLGTWLMECVQEVIESMPNLRRSMLLAGDWKRAVLFYERILGMELLVSKKGEDGSGQGLAVLMRKGRGTRDP
jgi:ribosomal protein S18 acetylase RimI-like enzyme